MFTVYCIRNLLDGQEYIGFTTQTPPEKRFIEHKRLSKPSGTSNTHLHRAMRRHGNDNFTFEIIEQG